jgi:hypothetical protein
MVDTSHVMFTFNDAANNGQHLILRELANSQNINAQSVLYVFPRITEKVEFFKNVGNLVSHTSFVPVLEIDQQASKKGITITQGTIHKYRTSYDGKNSEVNYYYYYFDYNSKIVDEILSELICVQIERLLRFFMNNKQLDYNESISDIKQAIETAYSEHSIKQNENLEFRTFDKSNLQNFLDLLSDKNWDNIPEAPSTYTTILSNEKMEIFKKQNKDFDSFSFQIF